MMAPIAEHILRQHEARVSGRFIGDVRDWRVLADRLYRDMFSANCQLQLGYPDTRLVFESMQDVINRGLKITAFRHDADDAVANIITWCNICCKDLNTISDSQDLATVWIDKIAALRLSWTEIRPRLEFRMTPPRPPPPPPSPPPLRPEEIEELVEPTLNFQQIRHMPGSWWRPSRLRPIKIDMRTVSNSILYLQELTNCCVHKLTLVLNDNRTPQNEESLERLHEMEVICRGLDVDAIRSQLNQVRRLMHLATLSEQWIHAISGPTSRFNYNDAPRVYEILPSMLIDTKMEIYFLFWTLLSPNDLSNLVKAANDRLHDVL